jgi:hypothetical protein
MRVVMHVVMVRRMAVGMPVMSVPVHSPVFYDLRRGPAALSTATVVGWLTTPGRDFVDGSESGCHYQKRCIRTSLMRRFTE